MCAQDLSSEANLDACVAGAAGSTIPVHLFVLGIEQVSAACEQFDRVI
jgi:hypothetical protein